MPLPNFAGKHDAEAVFEASDFVDQPDEPIPEAVVLCYQDGFFADVVATAGERLDVLSEGRMHRVADGVGAVGAFGVGSAVTAGVLEELAALGVETVCILGGAGCLDPSIPPERALVATEAIRDEGASYHYLPPEAPAEPSPALTAELERSIAEADLSVETGPTWTTDAFFRETVPEVRQYREDGVRTVEMEAATLFAVAACRDLDAGAVFSIGDYVTPEERTVPAASHETLPALLSPVVDALAGHASE
jgi:uridine phosphorylase